MPKESFLLINQQYKFLFIYFLTFLCLTSSWIFIFFFFQHYLHSLGYFERKNIIEVKRAVILNCLCMHTILEWFQKLSFFPLKYLKWLISFILRLFSSVCLIYFLPWHFFFVAQLKELIGLHTIPSMMILKRYSAKRNHCCVTGLSFECSGRCLKLYFLCLLPLHKPVDSQLLNDSRLGMYSSAFCQAGRFSVCCSLICLPQFLKQARKGRVIATCNQGSEGWYSESWSKLEKAKENWLLVTGL